MPEIMLGTKIVEYNVIYKNIKHSYLRVVGKDQLLITSNMHMETSQIIQFIKKHEKRILMMISSSAKKPLISHEFFLLFGKNYPFEIQKSKKNSIQIIDNTILFSSSTGEIIPSYIESFYQKKLLEKATQFIDELKYTLGKEINIDHLIFKSQKMKTQFGSCHVSKRIIKLNSILARFDEQYLYAILCHELVHLKVIGHQLNFYKVLEKYVPNYKAIRHQLKIIVSEYEV
jgi:hypothetical protein